TTLVEGLKSQSTRTEAPVEREVEATVEQTPQQMETAQKRAELALTPCDCLAPPQQPDEIGRLGPYRVLQVLGDGGMGGVFKAEDPKLKRLVALKVMKSEVAEEEISRQRFLREAQMTAALKNDHIITIYQVGEEKDVPFLAMEFLEGQSLDTWLKKGRKPT